MNKILIDVRTPEEFEKGRALNSINLNFYDQKFKDEILKNTKENQIYIYCRSGRRSEIATKYLNENGFTNVFNIKSGIIKIDSHYLDFSPLNN
jgi:rhodanese-related sulfurtransferase